MSRLTLDFAAILSLMLLVVGCGDGAVVDQNQGEGDGAAHGAVFVQKDGGKPGDGGVAGDTGGVDDQGVSTDGDQDTALDDSGDAAEVPDAADDTGITPDGGLDANFDAGADTGIPPSTSAQTAALQTGDAGGDGGADTGSPDDAGGDAGARPPALLAADTNVFQTVSATAAGKVLCGNITVESLSKIPIPEALTTGSMACAGACTGSKAYTYCGSGQPVGAGCNSLPDTIVGGCKVPVVGCLFTVAVINATQPDTAGAGRQNPLTLGAGNKVPDNQVTGNTRGYSSYFNFAANRAHATGRSP